MMKTLALLMACGVLHADTVTRRDHLSVNGTVIRVSGGELTIQAGLTEGNKTFSYKLTEIESIEFNLNTFNPGGPPKAPGFGGTYPAPPPAPLAASQATDTLVIRGGQRKECRLISIDQQFIHCEGKDGDYSRGTTLRVLIGLR